MRFIVGNRLGIFGAGGHGKVVAEAAEASGWKEVVFFEEPFGPVRDHHEKWRIAGDCDSLLESLAELDGVIVAIGDNKARIDRLNLLKNAGGNLVSVVHPSAVLSPSMAVGAGSCILAGAVVNAGARIGSGVILNTACSVDHDCMIGPGVHVSPGAHLAGHVWVGAGTWLGIGSIVRDEVRIGAMVTVGAGAVVVKDVADGLCVVGVPARPLETA